jgi:hypothetical protein
MQEKPKRVCMWLRRAERRDEATERNDARRFRSAAEQIYVLDDRFGHRWGAAKERARLRKQVIEAA